MRYACYASNKFYVIKKDNSSIDSDCNSKNDDKSNDKSNCDDSDASSNGNNDNK